LRKVHNTQTKFQDIGFFLHAMQKPADGKTKGINPC